MKLFAALRRIFRFTAPEPESETLPGADEDPFPEPVVLEIRDVIDLHPIPPRQIKAVVTEYLSSAHERGFRYVRIIHGKGIGTQREMVRAILARTPFVVTFSDAPPEAGGWGATIAELLPPEQESARADLKPI